MKKYISYILIVTLTACASPALQSDIFTKSVPDMEKVDSECREKNTHVAAVNCRFDAYEVILGERGFQEYNDLETLKQHFLSLAKQQDAHKLTDKKALGLFEKYTQEFYASLQQHDRIKHHFYEVQKQQTMAVIGVVAGGLGAGLQAYSTARYPAGSPTYQPACPACEQGIQQEQQWQQQQQADQQRMQQQQEAQAQQQQLQQQQDEINRLNGRSPVEVFRDCAHAGNCVGAFAPPSAPDSYGSYGSVPNMQ